MSGNLPIVFKAKKNFDIEKFCQSLKDSFDFSCSGSGESRLCKLEFINLTIKIDKKSITIQGQLNKESREILSKLNTLEYLTLDQKNIKKYSEIFQPKNGLIICQECGTPSDIIDGRANESGSIEFQSSCRHELQTNSPILIVRNRLLPDMNVLISRTLSRLIEDGFFNGFEIVIPEYYGMFVDQCFNSKSTRRSGFLAEIDKLTDLGNDGKIQIYKYPCSDKIENCNEEGKIEDNVIYDIAVKTFSLLLTGDKTLKTKSKENKLDCIFITQELNSAAKEKSKLT